MFVIIILTSIDMIEFYFNPDYGCKNPNALYNPKYLLYLCV